MTMQPSIELGLAYDDVLLIPCETDVIPSQVITKTYITKNLQISNPIISAAMDTVTEEKMAIEMAQLGAIGIIHRNLSIENQVKCVKLVKSAKVNRETEFTPSVDKNGKLLVGAAVGFLGDSWQRAEALKNAGVDVIVVDTAHGHSKAMLEMISKIKSNKSFDSVDIIGGNIGTYEGAKCLIDAGVDAVKVGIGPGSICTTRIIAGVGIPQLTAVMNAAKATKEARANGNFVPLIADGGLHYSGDIAKALVAGADSVMVGSMLAGTDEAPGELMFKEGKRFKYYRGMGSMGAMSSRKSESFSKDRYFQADAVDDEHLIPEGIEAQVKYKGSLKTSFMQLIGGLHQSMFYTGAINIEELHKRGRFVQITQAGLRESHPHDVQIIESAPNYSGYK
jgi:IMP dehydrogenase